MNDPREPSDASPDDESDGQPADAGTDDGPFDFSFVGALGVDPDQPDPGCEHDWQNLHFVEDDEGIVCSRCGKGWSVDGDDTRDAVLTLWNSTRRAVADVTVQLGIVNRIIEELTGMVRCHWCQQWTDDADRLVDLVHRRACPEHVGQLVGDVSPAQSDEVRAAAAWLTSTLADGDGDVHAAWIAEKAAVECPDLAVGEVSIAAIGARPVTLPAAWERRLGLIGTVTVDRVTVAVARVLELPAPTSRAGRAFLLGTLALSLRATSTNAGKDAETLSEHLMEAAPVGNRDRATVILDLYRDEMQVDGTVTGEMADDLVEALLVRAAAEFAPLVLHATPETGAADTDPR